MTKEEVGLKVKELRQKTGKSQEELGKALDRSHAAVSDIERGKTDLSVSDLYKIANFFEVPITEFLTGDLPGPNSDIHSRDTKDITPEEEKLADKYKMMFVELARKMAKEQSDK